MMDNFDIGQIDDVIHGRVRLGIMAYLSSAGMADFTALRTHLGVTDGNLSTHLRKLEDAGYVVQDKGFAGRRPLTRLILTDSGRSAFIAYLDAIRRLVDQNAPGD
ncbi:transcriptional regulator [Gluconacetobacter aggeris]|uniref:Transcriptional regulator n=1 Tax=Gluconacetobacter aggeris TaxID=1286186 RepID=A0A7W4NUN4_9PROT|nr:transcriptional regulator [Gluconacetobacter aggeris]